MPVVEALVLVLAVKVDVVLAVAETMIVAVVLGVVAVVEWLWLCP